MEVPEKTKAAFTTRGLTPQMGTAVLRFNGRDGKATTGESCMATMDKVTDTVFVVKEEQEFCFLFDRDDPIDLYRALFRCAERTDSGLSREEVLDVIEGMVPERLRSI